LLRTSGNSAEIRIVLDLKSGKLLYQADGHMDFAKHFQRNPKICAGETVITGTRVTLRTVWQASQVTPLGCPAETGPLSEIAP
jgi:hypothetical protein